MHVSTALHYPGSTPDAVFAMLVDKDFQDRKCLATGALDHQVEITEFDDGSTTITTVRTMPTNTLPDLARSLVGATLSVKQVEDWAGPAADGSREGTLLVEVEGAPVRMTGTLRLAPGSAEQDGAGPDGAGLDGAGQVATSETVEGEIKVAVPLIGGTLEKLIAPAILAATTVEQRTGLSWLAG